MARGLKERGANETGFSTRTSGSFPDSKFYPPKTTDDMHGSGNVISKSVFVKIFSMLLSKITFDSQRVFRFEFFRNLFGVEFSFKFLAF
jgi:hypothetical protein